VVEDETAGDVVAVGVAEGGVVAVHGGDAAEEELGDIGDGDGVETRDAFAGQLADEIAEERVYRVGGGEVGQIAEELGGGVVVMPLVLFFEQTGVVGAQFQIGNGGEETTAAVEPVDVAARGESYLRGSYWSCGRCGFDGCRLESCRFGVHYGLREGFGGQRDPSPGCFDARV
jgi:hypothetical protein